MMNDERHEMFLRISNNKLILEDLREEQLEITSLSQLFDAIESADYVLCSSSIDFPEDETNDPNIIAICTAFRGLQEIS